MCDPISATVTALNVAGGVAQAGSAVVGHRAQRRAFRANQNAAMDAFRSEVEALGVRGVQINQAASEDVVSQAIDAARQRAVAQARGVSQGLSSVSLADVLQSVSFAEGRSVTATRRNRDMQIEQNQREIGSAGARAQSRIASVARPNAAATALNVLGGIAQGGQGLISAGVLRIPTPAPQG